MRRHAKAPSAGSISSTGLRGLLAAAALATLALALGASPALSAQTHPFETSLGAGNLTSPTNLAVDQDSGNLYVADPGGSDIRKLNSSGAPVDFSALGTNSIGPIAYDGSATQVAVDNSAGTNDGDLYVTNSFGGGIQAFQASGAPANFSASAPYISANTLTGTPGGAFGEACGVAVDSNGAIYVGDYYNGVAIFAPSGEHLITVASASVCNVAVDSAGNIYANSWNGGVTELSPSSFPVSATTTYSAPATVTTAASRGVAVDPTNDNLYVNNGTYVAQYSSATGGNVPVGLFGSAELAGGSTGVAADRSGGANDGDVLTLAGGLVDRFGPAILIPNASTEEATGLTPLAATLHGKVGADGGPDTTCQFVYVSDADFQSSGYASAQSAPCSPAGPFTGSGEQAVSAAISGLVPETTYHFRLEATNANGVNRGPSQVFTTPGSVVTGAATNLTTSTATLHATVNPAGVELSECKFEYGPTTAYGSIAPCAESNAAIGSGEVPVAVHADLTGLGAVDYHFRLVATNAFGASKGQDATFSIAAPPLISDQSATPSYPEATYAEALFKAKINPNNGVTKYHFEYGPTTAYGQSTTEKELKATTSFRDVLALASPLDKGSTYHFRLVASNVAGSANGPDQTFAVAAGAPVDACSNAAIRAKQGISDIAECRAYELTSPVEKLGNGLDFLRTVQSSPSGDAVAYAANGAFAGAESSTLGEYYESRRGADGWSAEALDAPQANREVRPATTSLYLSEDLTKTVQFSQRALTPGAIEGGGNLYLRNNLTGGRTLLAVGEGNLWGEDLVPVTSRRLLGATGDLSHFVFFAKPGPVLPEAGPTENLYDATNGELRLIGRLPDGSVAPGASILSSQTQQARPVSADGRRIVFTADGGNGGLYMRIDNSKTIPISASKRASDLGTMAVATFFGMSDDGDHVFFSSGADLVEGLETHGLGHLYRYDVDEDQLTDLTAPSGTGNFSLEIGLNFSLDGDYFYFSGSTGLIPPTKPYNGSVSVYVAHGDQIQQVASVRSYPSSMVSPSGRYFAFVTGAPQTGEDNTGPQCGEDGSCAEVYLYDAQTDTTKCLSCHPLDGVDRPAGLFGGENEKISQYLPRLVSDDGSVAFDSRARLLPGDVNDKTDVYRWHDGALALVSSGKGSTDARVAEVSADGRNVFFFTADRLVASDTDGLVDLYDARVGGGIAAQNVPPRGTSLCEGDGCRGPLGGAQESPAVTTAGFSGPGNAKRQNPKLRSRCKGKARKQKKKCHARKRAGKKASSNRRGN